MAVMQILVKLQPKLRVINEWIGGEWGMELQTYVFIILALDVYE